MAPMPEDAHTRPPKVRNTHTVAECDEVLRRGCVSQEVTDAWLEERSSAMLVNDSEIMSHMSESQLARELTNG